MTTAGGSPRADSSQGVLVDVQEKSLWPPADLHGPDLDRLLGIPAAALKAGPPSESNPRLHALLAEEERLTCEPLQESLCGMAAPLSAGHGESDRSEAESLVGQELLAYLIHRQSMKQSGIASTPEQLAASTVDTARRDVLLSDPPTFSLWLSLFLVCLVLNRWDGRFPEIRLWAWPSWELACHHEPRPGPVVSPRPPRV